MNEKMNLLLAEDDMNLSHLLIEYFEINNFKTFHALNGKDALNIFNANQIDLCIFDVMMPIMDGFTLATEVRKINDLVPIIFLTAKSLKIDVQEGFKLGADDYITKPFDIKELMLRIQAIIKRTSNKSDINNDEYKIGHYTFNYVKQELSRDGVINKLTTKENELLKTLYQKKNQILKRDIVLKKIWPDENLQNTRSLDVYILKLRKLLEKDKKIQILNVHGKGFKMIIDE